MAYSTSSSSSSLTDLPSEILLLILSHLAIPDLHSLSRASHRLRTLSTDPILHLHRLHHAAYTLSITLPQRPSIRTLRPPHSLIIPTRTYILARSVSRSLVCIRLTHYLLHRPLARELVDRAILPRECCAGYWTSPISPALIQSRQAVLREKLKDGLSRKLERRPSVSSLVSMNILPAECTPIAGRRNGGTVVSPALVATRRRVIRERLKDGLRAWVEGRMALAQKRKFEHERPQHHQGNSFADDGGSNYERLSVPRLVRRFTARYEAEQAAEMPIDTPTPTNTSTTTASRRKHRKAQSRWAQQRQTEGNLSSGEGACSQPTRAHVLGLRRFWEGVIRAAAVG